MTLEELIEQAAPLPWSELPQFPSRDIGYVTIREDANERLAKHAVNMLPKLAEAVSRVVELETRDDRRYVTGARACKHDEWITDSTMAMNHLEEVLAEANNPPTQT